MKLITHFELATCSTNESHVLYREVFNALARSAAGRDVRRLRLASLENISAELRGRPHP